ncbi:hypothetical protein [Metabacillus idriensis]|uniref:hypothetical protein n=1 Tax=Metabacillus idriensis TaxID=324768 RepID=UPI001639A574|nr:hypothetical protein [Metabacillus idriensis]QNG59308.1 hypothetical protein H4O14_16125 [Bacillus sp. PAMC26568]
MERSFYDLLSEKGGELEHLLNNKIHSKINQKEVVEFAGILVSSGIGKIKRAKELSEKHSENLNLAKSAKLMLQMDEKIAHMSAWPNEMKKNPGALVEKAEVMIDELEDKAACLCKAVQDLKKNHTFSCAAKKLEAHLECLQKSVCELKHKQTHEKKRNSSESLIISSQRKNENTKKGRILFDD